MTEERKLDRKRYCEKMSRERKDEQYFQKEFAKDLKRINKPDIEKKPDLVD